MILLFDHGNLYNLCFSTNLVLSSSNAPIPLLLLEYCALEICIENFTCIHFIIGT